MEITGTRLASLEPIREEHDHSLQLCAKIRHGLHNNIEPDRIREYTDWFRENYLERHFEMEKDYVFPVLGKNARVKRALANHRRIIRLLSCNCENEKVLNLLEEELRSYIGFEERILYKELLSTATSKQLEEIERQHDRLKFTDDEWEDKFWMVS